MLKHNLKTNRLTWVSDTDKINAVTRGVYLENRTIYAQGDIVYYNLDLENYRDIPESDVYMINGLVNNAFSMTNEYLVPNFINQYATAACLKHRASLTPKMVVSVVKIAKMLLKNNITFGPYMTVKIDTTFKDGEFYILESREGISICVGITSNEVAIGYLDELASAFFNTFNLNEEVNPSDSISMFTGLIYLAYTPGQRLLLDNTINVANKLTPINLAYMGSRMYITL